ncbi:MFS transporter [Streptomyces sp. NPDC050549]|uniref:MFS transporter n=1 Tax=Streptomyces sp. NPDC050549 TaxID=3155406 RepID=UPI00341E053F
MSAGLSLAVLSTTVVSVALPYLGRDLGGSATGLEWVVDAYVVVYASMLAPGGVLGDRWGRKGLFLAGVALFAVGSAITGLAPSMAVLLAGRVIQGLGPALLVPGSLTIIRAVFDDPRRRATAIGLWSTCAGLAMAAGPPLGGLIVAGLGWRWVFLLNVPLAGLVFVLGVVSVPRLPRAEAQDRFDVLGAALVVFALAALAFGVITAQDRGWTAPLVWTVFVAGLLALAGFVRRQLRQPRPLVDVRLFRSRAFTAANLAAFVVFFTFIGGIVYFTAYVQQARGASPINAGLNIVPMGIAYALGSGASGRLVGRIGERWPLVLGLAVAGVSALGLLRLDVTSPYSAIWWNFALLGAGIGLCGTPMNTIAMSAVDAKRAGMASAIINTLRQVGQVFGVAVLGALVYGAVPGGHVRTTADRARFVTGLHHALWVSGLALLATAAICAALLFSRVGAPEPTASTSAPSIPTLSRRAHQPPRG